MESNEDDATSPTTVNTAVDLEVESTGATASKGKSKTSEVWTYFTDIGPNEKGIGRSQCKGCKTILLSGGKTYGTSTLRRHMKSCKLLKYHFHDISQTNFDCDGTIRSKKLNIGLAREVFAAAIVEHDCPFAFAEYPGFRKYHKLLNPDAPMISRNTLVSDINKLYLKEKNKLKQVLTSIPNRICLTSDLWIACTTEGYICLTSHFVDEKWKLNSKILAFDKMPPPHTGFELAQKMYEILKDWGIEKKVFSLTLDNASNNDSMQDILKDQLTVHDSLLCDGEFFHIRCSAHILNLIVQEGLKAANHTLHRIRESVKYAKSTESRMKKFQECVVEVGGIDTSIGLRLDMPVRWNSTYLMLDSAIRYKKVFSLLQLKDKNFKVCPSNEEWKRRERLCAFFKPFYEMTNLISGSSYPTSNVYFLQVWKIERLLKEGLSDEDTSMNAMCERMLEKFDKYWSEYSVVLAFGAVLDPRFKFKVLEKLYAKVETNPTKCQAYIEMLRKKLYKLYDQYVSAIGSSSSQTSSTTIMHSRVESQVAKKFPKRLFDDVLDVSDEIIEPVEIFELDRYLEQPCYEMKFYQDLDVLDYWKGCVQGFPILSCMARDLLAIPITTVASESAFSIGARVLTKYRSCLLPEKVQTLICTRNWLHGFNMDDDDVDEGNNGDEGDDMNEDELNDGMSCV